MQKTFCIFRADKSFFCALYNSYTVQLALQRPVLHCLFLRLENSLPLIDLMGVSGENRRCPRV